MELLINMFFQLKKTNKENSIFDKSKTKYK